MTTAGTTTTVVIATTIGVIHIVGTIMTVATIAAATTAAETIDTSHKRRLLQREHAELHECSLPSGFPSTVLVSPRRCMGNVAVG
mmetsp:Transcript_28094/g.68131  ORF Transcript_28094/g.68131 Transcript_28094/m.68131 type:complete len:85 (-) Transcript_28094:450-704(-)